MIIAPAKIKHFQINKNIIIQKVLAKMRLIVCRMYFGSSSCESADEKLRRKMINSVFLNSDTDVILKRVMRC